MGAEEARVKVEEQALLAGKESGGQKKQVRGIHSGIDARLARKFINHTHKYINEYIETSDNLKNTGIRCNLV